MSGLSSVGYFLVMTFFSALTFVLWARLFIRYFGIGTFHPFSQTIYKLTAPAITPIHNMMIRGIGAGSRYDVACFITLLCCEIVKFLIINVLFLNNALTFISILRCTLADVVIQPCNLLFYAVIIRTIMSWINPFWQNPFQQIIFLVTEPMLKTIRNALPNFGMLDLSPFAAIILIKAFSIFAASIAPIPML